MNHREFATVDLTCLLYTSDKIDLSIKNDVQVNRTGLNLNQLESNHVKFDVVQIHSELKSERLYIAYKRDNRAVCPQRTQNETP